MDTLAAIQIDYVDFLRFVRAKPAAEHYYFGDPRRCAFGQYRAANSLGVVSMFEMGENLTAILCGSRHGGDTFGALAQRLEDFLHNLDWSPSDPFCPTP